MFKRQRHFVLFASLVASVSGLTSTASVADDKSNANLDHVLNALSHQHTNASDLVKSARQPSALAFDSQLLTQDTTYASKDSGVLERLSAVASSSVNRFQQSGTASWYGRQFNGRKTASGETFNQNGLTAAHRSLPLNCYVRVTNKSNGKSVVVKVNDRGPFHANRVMDLSYGAAKRIGITNTGTGNVSIERVSGPN